MIEIKDIKKLVEVLEGDRINEIELSYGEDKIFLTLDNNAAQPGKKFSNKQTDMDKGQLSIEKSPEQESKPANTDIEIEKKPESPKREADARISLGTDITKLISRFVHDNAFGSIFDADVKKAGFGLT